jgi:hypothetical protein
MLELFGGPDRDRTDDLFHVMEGACVEALLDERFDFRLMNFDAHG